MKTGELLQQWFLSRLGILHDLTPEIFGQHCQDGRLLAQMLYSYNVINLEQLESIHHEDFNYAAAFANLQQIKQWFEIVGFHCDDRVLGEIADGNGNAAIKLFYEFYLTMQDWSKLHYLTLQRLNEKCHPSETRFEIQRVPDIKEVNPDEPDSPLAYPLLEGQSIIQWHKNRYKALIERYKGVREEYIKYLKEKCNNQITKTPSEVIVYEEPKQEDAISTSTIDKEDLTYEQLVEEQLRVANLPPCEKDTRAAKRYVKQLKARKTREDTRNILQRELQNTIMSELWDAIILEENKKMDKLMAEKLLKQSDYEKQIVGKMLEVRNQKEVFTNNRKAALALYNKAREAEFLGQVYLEGQNFCAERGSYYFERERALALHKKLLSEKKRLLHERNHETCEEIVQDIADTAIAYSEYTKEYNVEPPRRKQKEWADLFCTMQPIFELVEDKTRIVDVTSDLVDEIDEIIHLEITRQNAVDKENFHDYLENKWPWILDELLENYEADLKPLAAGMNVLGFAVHRVLETKYPRRPLPTRPELPATQFCVCINNVTDLTILPVLQKLVSQRGIKIVELSEAINYCLDAYKNEATREHVDEKLVEGTEDVQKGHKIKEKFKKGAKKKESAKEKHKKKKGKKGKESATHVAVEEVSKQKETQTPIYFPFDEIVFTEQATLGKQAYEVLSLGGTVPDELLVAMLIQYLKTLTDYKGWAIVNYPTSFEQAVLLENSLTGQPIPKIIAKIIAEEGTAQNVLQDNTQEVQGVVGLQTDDAPTESVLIDYAPMYNSVSSNTMLENITTEQPPVDSATLSDKGLEKTTLDTDEDKTFGLLGTTKANSLQDSLEYLFTMQSRDIQIIATKCMPPKTNFLRDRLLNDLQKLDVACSCQVSEDLRFVQDYCDLNYERDLDAYEAIDTNAEFRESEIVPNPNSPPVEDYYQTMITAFINIVPRPADLNLDNTDTEPLEEKPDKLNEFYSEQGCNYTLYYELFDFNTIKHLAKLIIGDFTLPPKPSLTIFGDVILFVEAALHPKPKKGKGAKGVHKGEKKVKKPPSPKATEEKHEEHEEEEHHDKKKKGKKDKKSKEHLHKKDKKGKKGKKSKTDLASQESKHAVEEPIPPPPTEVPVEEVIPEPPPKPGEVGWKYITEDLPLAEEMQVVLGTLWENLEDVYVSDFMELFFLKRTFFNMVIPYTAYIMNYMMNYIQRPDNKQDILSKFQQMYNNIDDDIRVDEELKAEMHCRIAEFRDQLYEITDQRRIEAENERQRIIEENWFSTQMAEMLNIYITCMQLEMDRNADSLAFLSEYYSNIVTQTPTAESPFQKTILPSMPISSISSNVKVESAVRSFQRINSQMNAISGYFKHPETEIAPTYLHKYLNQAYNQGWQSVTHADATATDICHKMQHVLSPNVSSPKKKKEKAPGKHKKKSASSKGHLPTFIEPDIKVREVGPVLIEEWEAAILGEKLRAQQRLNMLKYMCEKDLNTIMNHGGVLFHSLHGEVKDRYVKEVAAIDTCCEVFCKAVEAEVKLQPQMVLESGEFFVRPEILLFPDPLPHPEPPFVEKPREGMFSMHQLQKLVNVLQRIAPTGSIPERSFTYILQDIITNKAEDGQHDLVPELWLHLKPAQTGELVKCLFGTSEYIDWRDFVVQNLYIYPTELELLTTRQQFRSQDTDITETVTSYQYYETTLWFEHYYENSQELFRNRMMKQLLFNIFRTGDNTFNYTAFLLAFCKDCNPILGFAMAIELSMGKYACWKQDMGQKFVQETRRQRFLEEQAELYRQQCHAEAVETSNFIMDDLIDVTVHECDSVVIEEYIETDAERGEMSMDILGQVLEDCFRLSETAINEGADVQNEGGDAGKCQENTASRTTISHCTCDSDTAKGQVTLFPPESYLSGEGSDYDQTNTGNFVYYLPFEVLLNIMTAALPWHSRVQSMDSESFRQRYESLYDESRNPEFDCNVLIHEFVHTEKFKELLNSNYKFSSKHPATIVKFYTMLNAE